MMTNKSKFAKMKPWQLRPRQEILKKAFSDLFMLND